MRPADWIVPDWPASSRVRAFITTRAGGVSAGPYATFNLGDLTADDPDAVRANKARLDTLLPGPPRWLRQVHGARVVHADDLTSAVQADAAYTATPGVVCAVKIADCMPVLIADAAGTVVAVAHAGWRGLAAGVLENTVAALPVAPAALMAYLGPAIGPSAFEVGDEVRAAFCAVDAAAAEAFRPLRPGKWLADLFRLGRERLAHCGVTHVHGGGLCTYSNPERFYSHRRNPVTGRMAALIWIGERGA
ncbi:MAG: peptidoglycan editing factor PgeF [Betaproteobacteria bacterium]|nr:peptidoglycan editing factor PgeF [Betaproteobacteria bacterium]